VGAHEDRNHFGWYMERATAGEQFLITRRGKPYARLSPPHAQLAAADDELASRTSDAYQALNR
jgi:prevent-host-death family protein